jgi:hypothetical protein
MVAEYRELHGVREIARTPGVRGLIRSIFMSKPEQNDCSVEGSGPFRSSYEENVGKIDLQSMRPLAQRMFRRSRAGESREYAPFFRRRIARPEQK